MNNFEPSYETPLYETSIIPEKKKRGRKPKNKSIMDFVPAKTKILKKRGRKTINNKIIDIIPDNNIDIISNLIVHLPLKINDINKIINMHQPKYIEEIKQEISQYVDFSEDLHIQKSYISAKCSLCSEYINKINKLEDEIINLKNGIIIASSNFNKKIYESKVSFINRTIDKYNENTTIACWWCCHSFQNIPLGIPEYINKNIFNLFGCFCSFNCMMAYNIDINDYKIWDRQSNIYQMKNKIDPENKISIHPAPPRQTLEMFGGPLDINKYRETFFIVNKEYRYFFPPMISLIGLIEEDNVNLTNYTNINKQSNKVMLKRNKTLINKNNKLIDIIKTN